MKKPLLTVGLLSILIIYSACTTVSTFSSPNNLEDVKSTLYLNDGRSISGYLSINTENRKNSKISIEQEHNNKLHQFKLKNIKGYTTGADKYKLKEVENNTIIIEKGNSLLEQLFTKKKYYFMQQLTADSSRIHLFKNDYIIPDKENNNSTGQRVIEYYIQLPNQSSNMVYPIDGKMLHPHFEEKMSALVSDCPALAQKIANRAPGYFYSNRNLPVLSIKVSKEKFLNDSNIEVIMNIINEYNNCK